MTSLNNSSNSEPDNGCNNKAGTAPPGENLAGGVNPSGVSVGGLSMQVASSFIGR